ncbi:gamma-glutamyltransferase [Oceaniglobus indicus]|uniref:gamma-glutamyltransferase n=1 Tax=Oceaniglobus indicus TaxID=2047749 RepID=UPI001F4EB6AC|nr:gamma-glutamyltransferase [Oceaniglobus indicus]
MSVETEHWSVTKSAVTAADGMVAAQHHLAARAGADVLHRGGNAVDAAIGAALALGVVEPWMCGLGGSGVMTVWLADEGRAMTLDFQGVLADATDPADYPVDADLPMTLMGFPTVQGNANVEGYRSITVPGAAAGFDRARRRWGTMAMADIAAPAIELAERGVPADWFTTLQCALAMEVLQRDPVSAAIYLPGGRPIQPEAELKIPNLAETLHRFAVGGAEAFYAGALAELLARDLAAGGSVIRAGDLNAYAALEAEAETGTHRGATLHTPGTNSGGTRLRDFLGGVADAMAEPPQRPDPESWATYAHAMNIAWRAHNARIGRGTEMGACTSHLSTADDQGNMVALTHTLLNRFGSGVTLPATGLLMNNAVSYFDPRPGFPTTMAGGKRINASNMCPTVATRGGGAIFALGASGGNHIMPAVAQVAALMLDFGMTLEQAMNHPRLDASDRGSVRADPMLGHAVLDRLAREHVLEIAQRLTFPKLYACVSGVAMENGRFSGLNDPSQPVGGASGPGAMVKPTSGPERSLPHA